MTTPTTTANKDFQSKTVEYNQKLSFLSDLELIKNSKNLSELLKKKSISISSEEIKIFLEESLKRQITHFAKNQYLLMEKKDDFGDAGEQRVAISFCRVLLNIPANREVTQVDANLFREEITKQDELLGKPSADKLSRMIKQTKLNVFGKDFDFEDSDLVNQIFEFVGSDLRVSYAGKGGVQSFLYGKQKTIKGYDKKYKNLSVLLQQNEVARTPYFILSMAASSYPWGTLIRHESCETIFYNKWYSYFETSDFERDLLLSHDYSNIREAIKKKAFVDYGINSKADIDKKKDLFIDEMIEGIVWHELGHEISLEDNPLIDRPTANLGSAIGSFGNNAITVLKEALADWAPLKDEISGPILNFARLAKTDYQKAKRMIYVYLSDYWFLDFGEEFMGETTDIIVPLLTQFMNAEGDFEFNKLEKVHQEIYEYLSKKYKEGIAGIKNIIQSAKFQMNSSLLTTYQTLEVELIKLYRKDPAFKDVPDETITSYSAFWVNILGYLKKFAPADYEKFQQYLKDYTKKFNIDLLNKLTGGKSENFSGNIRDYVIKRMKHIGCYEEEATLSEEDLLNSIYEELKIPENVIESVDGKLKMLKEGKEKLEVAINYDAKPSALIAVIQKLMLMSDYGDIKSGMSLGEDLSEDLAEPQKIQELHKLIAGVKKQISEKMYEKISLIKFNTDYLSEEVFKKEFATIATKGTFDLTPLVKETKYLPFFEEHMMEVFIPLKKGVWDWNTVQAVWRINQDLRPDESEKQWTIDRVLVEELIKRALLT